MRLQRRSIEDEEIMGFTEIFATDKLPLGPPDEIGAAYHG